MIKEKYIKIITLSALSIAIIFALVLMILSSKQQDVVLNTPEYINQIFDKNKVMDINIQVDEDKWNNLLENAMDEEYIPCDITINGTTYSTVGIRAKGNSSLSMVAQDENSDRYSFKVSFDQYVSDQNLSGLTKIALNNSIGDATYMKEYLSYDMMNEMGINTPAYSYANIKVNGEEWGLYLAVEPLEEEYLERYYGENYGNLYKPESLGMGNMQHNNKNDMKNNNKNIQNNPMQNQEQAIENNANQNQVPPINQEEPQNKEGENRERMHMTRDTQGTDLVYSDDNLSSYSGIFKNAITKKTDNSDKKLVVEMIKNLNAGTNLNKYLDVEEILSYFAVNTFLVNLDSYAGPMKHNYYLYEQDGKFQILPWDFNLSFGGFEVREVSKAINFPIDAPVTDTMEKSPLIAKLLEVDEYKELYHNYINTLIDKYISSGKFDSEVDRIDNLISEYVKNDATAFYTYDEYKNSLPELKTFVVDRTKSILAQLSGSQPSTTYGDISTTLNLNALGTMHNGMDNKNMKPRENMDLNAQNIDQNNNNSRPTPPPGHMNNEPKITKQQIYTIIVYIICIIIGLIFAFKFKRRKYRS